MKVIKKLNTIILLLLSWIVYGLSFLVPRSKNIWIFIGWHQNNEREIFADNSKYMFLYTANNLKNIRAVWIGKDKKICKALKAQGYEAYPIYSGKGIYYSLRSKYTFLDANMKLENWRLSGGSNTIQLWHGKGPKKIGLNSPYSMGRFTKLNNVLNPNLFKKFYLFIASSEYIAGLVSGSFGIKIEKVLVSGLPKYDVLFRDVQGSGIDTSKSLEKEIKKAKLENFAKIIFYAPTFRPDGTNPLVKLDLNKLNDILDRKKYFLIVSLHPKFSAQEWMPKYKLSNISFVESGYDIYPLLHNFDILITDYSSTAVDFILLDKPIIFFVYDLEKYKKNMGLHEDFWNLLPGPRAATFVELLKILEIVDKEKEKREVSRKKLFKFCDGNASARISEALLRKIYR